MHHAGSLVCQDKVWQRLKAAGYAHVPRSRALEPCQCDSYNEFDTPQGAQVHFRRYTHPVAVRVATVRDFVCERPHLRASPRALLQIFCTNREVFPIWAAQSKNIASLADPV